MVDSKNNPAVAIVFMLVATVFIAGTTLMAKTLGTDMLGPKLHPLQITFGRFAFAWLVLVAFLPFLFSHLNTRPNMGLHIARTTCGAGGVTLMFAAVAFIPLADATAISFLNPVFGMIFAFFFLRERVGPWRWTAAVIALFGAMILLRPGPDTFRPEALLALGAALILGFELIFIKKLSGRETPYQILLTNNSIGLCMVTVAVLFVWQAPTAQQWLALAGVGVLMACAQGCFVNAMRRADASFIVVFSYATLVFAALYDAVLFDVFPDWVSILGAATILSGAFLMAWREGRVRPSADSRA
nr:DMT family transporter [Pseudaestuariivita rosea]